MAAPTPNARLAPTLSTVVLFGLCCSAQPVDPAQGVELLEPKHQVGVPPDGKLARLLGANPPMDVNARRAVLARG